VRGYVAKVVEINLIADWLTATTFRARVPRHTADLRATPGELPATQDDPQAWSGWTAPGDVIPDRLRVG